MHEHSGLFVRKQDILVLVDYADLRRVFVITHGAGIGGKQFLPDIQSYLVTLGEFVSRFGTLSAYFDILFAYQLADLSLSKRGESFLQKTVKPLSGRVPADGDTAHQ